MDFTKALYEALKLDGDAEDVILAPQTLAAGANDSAWISMAGFRSVLFIVQLGALNDAAATVDIVIEQATDNAGTGAKALAGRRGAKAATQIVAGAGFATGNRLVLLYVRAEEMDVNNGFAFLNCEVTVSAGDTCLAAVVAARGVAEYKPVTDTNVEEIVD
jgi:hypothetical protein